MIRRRDGAAERPSRAAWRMSAGVVPNGLGLGHGPKGIGVGLRQRWRFLRSYLRSPNVVGAVAPSSTALAAALCEPFRRYPRPATVLEVGAGTGAITRHLGSILGEQDELDICEIEPAFVGVLRRDVLTNADFAAAVAAGRVSLLQAPVQKLPHRDRYDFIICCLPLNSFELRDVQNVFEVLRRGLKPGGVLSYFEYIGLRRTSRLLSLGPRRQRVCSVSRFLTRKIRAHQFEKRAVLRNFPPACARHLRFDAS